MPTIHRERGYRFFFFMADGYEPPHVHIEKDDNAAKLWLDPLEFSYVEVFAAMSATKYYISRRSISTNFSLRGIRPLEA
jgi:hypothetical protein